MSTSLFDADAIAKEIAGYVHHGLRVVRLYAPERAEVCMCQKGADCPSPGKHPTGKPWDTTADEDQVFEWWGGAKRFNVGVVLGDAGRGSGAAVIDVEADSDEGTAELRRLGLDRFPTPTWSSGRGLHRLFLWSQDLPPLQVVKWGGVEVRIGGGGRQTQSVMPPSIHYSGRAYQWQPGLSLGEVEIATIPDNVMNAIAAEVARQKGHAAGGGGGGKRSTAILHAPVHEGGRNDALFSVATMFAKSISVGDDAMEQALLAALRGINATQCRPPMDDGEVVSIFRSAMKYRREEAASRVLMPGVEAVVDGARVEHRARGWEVTIRQGDPTMFELRCDAFREFNPHGLVRVQADVWGDSRKMMLAMIAALPGMPINRYPGDFARIWDGVAPQAGSRNRPAREAVTGLRVQLEEAAIAEGRRVEVQDPAEHETRRLVGLLVLRLDWVLSTDEVVNTAIRCLDKEDPTEGEVVVEMLKNSHLGGAFRGRVWFHWDRVWARIAQEFYLERGGSMKVARAMPDIIGRKLEAQRFSADGARVMVRSLSMDELEKLRTFAAGGAATQPPSIIFAREV